MSKLQLLFATAVIAIGSAQGAVVPVTNPFQPGQAPPAGVTGLASPIFGTNGFDFGNAAGDLSAWGINFTFTSPTLDAQYGGNITGAPAGYDNVNTLAGPGDGDLVLNFTLPTTSLSFNILFLVPPAPPTVNVAIGGQGTQSATQVFTDGAWYVDSFTYTCPSCTFTTADINIGADTNAANSLGFFIENLSYDQPLDATPEPGSVVLLGAGLVSVGLWMRRRRPQVAGR